MYLGAIIRCYAIGTGENHEKYSWQHRAQSQVRHNVSSLFGYLALGIIHHLHLSLKLLRREDVFGNIFIFGRVVFRFCTFTKILCDELITLPEESYRL